ncbi:sialidase family protein [Aureimonas psammosilenae]|uniref:sialidase family protein n=1 Tax=Aureimonas psammosilenae TaxID=2495496 RepID=UPI0012605B8D|nr:sialidase family protein [Aureimonas psammosilenae]
MTSGERTILRDDRRYIAHPHMVRLAGGTLLLVATSGPRRPVTLHPPLDPDFVNLVIRSDDEGETWSAPVFAPSPDLSGMECAGLTALPDGSVLLNQWRFRWYAEEEAPTRSAEPLLAVAGELRGELDASLELDGGPTDTIRWSRGGGSVTVCRSLDAGRSWSSPSAIDVAPYSGGYGLRGGLVLPFGEILLPLSDVPHYARIFLVRSHDGGSTWSSPVPVAAVDGYAFEEPAPYLASDGSILLVLRENATRRLHSVRSTDGGRSWSTPVPNGLTGYPADLVGLGEGRVAAVTGWRDAPGEIRLHVSETDGRAWTCEPTFVAGNFGTRDCGYPTAVQLRNGDLLVAYYRRDEAGVTGIYARRVARGAAGFAQSHHRRPKAA